MTSSKPGCCSAPAPSSGRGKGLLTGLFYGLLPHTFCILFVVLSVVGATAATSVIQRFLYVPYLFQFIVALSFVFATLSAAFYLRRNGLLSWAGARFKWRYLTVMYATTIGINLLLFLVVFPMVANARFSGRVSAAGNPVVVSGTEQTLNLQVAIPCSGHAPLVMDELGKVAGITAVKYTLPDRFAITYDSRQISVEQILALPLFQEFKARAF